MRTFAGFIVGSSPASGRDVDRRFDVLEHEPAGCQYDRQFPRGDPETTGRLVRALDALLRDARDLRDRRSSWTESTAHSRVEDAPPRRATSHWLALME